MPLLDHFHAPLDDQTSWEGFHGAWPTMIVADLNSKLPRRYVAAPSVRLGAAGEIDVAAQDTEDWPQASMATEDQGQSATAVWSPPRPTLDVATELPAQDEYEVLVYDAARHRRLVAAVEIVSPSNKDRPEHRVAFVAKCVALLQQQVSVAIVDIVTSRRFNLYTELLETIGQSGSSLPHATPFLYAAECRWLGANGGRLQTWAQPMTIGKPLPILPLWLSEALPVPLELEETYQETCRILRIQTE